MKTWKEYYLECKDIYQKITKQDTTSTNIYDLGIMVDPFPTNQIYFDQISSIQKSLSNSVETIEVFALHPLTKYPKDIRYEHNFIQTPVAVSKKGNSQKPFPKEIPRKCIDVFSEEGDLILDCFAGSGTTGIVCEEMNRDYIGIEISDVVG